jgi:hypothetical protein
MSEKVPLEIVGDSWYNYSQFFEKLSACDGHRPIAIDLRSEGPSLAVLGVIDKIDHWLICNNRLPDSLTITKWANPVEWIPYQKMLCNSTSHFFSMSHTYWPAAPKTSKISAANNRLFGIFMGRLTIPRSVIFYDVAMQFGSAVLMSKMKATDRFPWDVDPLTCVNADQYQDWLSLNNLVKMVSWYLTDPIGSIDSMTLRDQYHTVDSYTTTNKSLLTFYDQFSIEIVMETYCRGNTFFPTEKTVRPLSAIKPMLVYGPKYFLARLRQLGFKTWHSVWDESYDLLEGVKRWQRMKSVMQNLTQTSAEQKHNIIQQAAAICHHNRRHLLGMLNEYDHIKKLNLSNDSE